MRGTRIVLLLAGALSASMAHAIPVEWRATCIVDATPPPFLFPFAVSAGDAVDFDYSFDTDAVCVLCEPNQASYDGILSRLVMRINDAAHEIPLNMSSLFLANDAPVRDGFLDAFVLTFDGIDADLSFRGTLALQNVLSTLPVPPLSGIELARLSAPPDPRAFPPSGLPDVTSNFFSFSVSQDGGFNSFGGNLTDARVLSSPPPQGHTDVPEPATSALLLSGLLGLMFARKSRPS